MKTVLLFILLVTAGCTNSSNGGSNQPAVPSSNAEAVGLITDLTIDINGVEREYHLFQPQQPSTAPIVVLLHGNRGSSDQILGLNGTKSPNKIWLEVALRENLILIIPNGAVGPEGHQGWNDCRTDALGNPGTDDVLFISSVIEFVSNGYKRTDVRVFVAGISNGGLMSMRLADEKPEMLRAFASVVASRPINTKCADATTPVSALFMNGTEDPILPYEGGPIMPDRGDLYSTDDTVAYWVNRNQTNRPLETVQLDDIDDSDNSFIKVHSYINGLNGTRVKHYEVVGGGHTEPSIAERYTRLYKLIVGEQNNDIEMAEEIWRYFDSL